MDNVTLTYIGKDGNGPKSTKFVYLAMYYTPQYQSAVGDVTATIAQQVAEVNSAFAASSLGVVFRIKCTTRLNLNEGADSGQRLVDIKNNRGACIINGGNFSCLTKFF